MKVLHLLKRALIIVVIWVANLMAILYAAPQEGGNPPRISSHRRFTLTWPQPNSQIGTGGIYPSKSGFAPRGEIPSHVTASPVGYGFFKIK